MYEINIVKFCSTLQPAAADVTLGFSIAKLVLFIGWIYFSLYTVHHIHFNSFIPPAIKPIVNFSAIFIGPVILFALVILEISFQYSQGKGTLLQLISQQLKGIPQTISIPGFNISKENCTIQLMDSSGRSIKDIYSTKGKDVKETGVIKLTNQVILNAVFDRASDILIDPKSDSEYTIRYRVDGILKTSYQINSSTCRAVINSIKAVSSMDISEKRRPQDGAFMAQLNDGTVSFRVASAGAVNGEKLSIRILNSQADSITLEEIGLSKKQRIIIHSSIKKPSGMMLVCGPTGSGKTTTMYSMLNTIDLMTRNVITVEDPIECILPDASQIEINPKADITFANSLRSILRQDPDVICVGEIRDEETAAIALRASQTGHLVLATIHCNSNASAIIRLLDLGVSPLLISSGLNMLISQRLIRQLCKRCRTRAQLSSIQIRDLTKRHINYANIYEAVGCKHCNNTGYYGRKAICDILQLDDNIKTGISNSEIFIDNMRKMGDVKGKSNLNKQGLKMVVSGETTFKELKRVLG